MESQHNHGLGERVAFLLRKATARVERMGGAALVPLHLDGRQYGALALLRHGGPRSQQELADALAVDRSTMVGLVDDLERRGFALRRRSPSDRRAYAIELTDAGADVQRRAEALLDACEQEFLSGLSAEEREHLRSLLERLATPGGGPPQASAGSD